MRGTILICLSFLLPTSSYNQNRYYLNQNATGGAQNGTTWVDAFINLQQAINTAGMGDTIWVAAGVYKPTTSNDRTLSIILKDGVALYGGFEGTESFITERNFEQHKTILSGDIGTPGMRTDNSYHVVRGKGLGNTTVLDGFYIREGYSYNDFPPAAIHRYGAGMLLEGAPGVTNSRPVIQNCFFENNNAQEGGALCVTWITFGSQPQSFNPVNPVLRNCTFSRNTAALYGGALYKNSPSVSDTFIIEDCRFWDNKAYTGQGGGIYFNLTANTNTVIRRCLFERDTSWTDAGGAISYYTDPVDTLNTYGLLLDSCVFRQNLALEGGAFLFDGYTSFIFGNNNRVKFDCLIQHCTFDGNVARTANGSAYYMFAGDKQHLNIEAADCTFKSNLASDITTTISFSQYNISLLKMNRCVFYKNHDIAGNNRLCMAISHGGGAFNTVTTEINNCLFYDNGGGVASTSQAKNYNTTRISNCTFFNNNEYIFVKTWDTLFNQSNGYYNDFYIDNCIIWEPGTNLRKMFYNNEPLINNMYGYQVNHSLLSLSDSTSVPGADAVFQKNLIWGQFPMFQDSLAGNLRLKTCSPAVNRGNNDIIFGQGLLDDLDGQPRLRYSIVDLGAYEQQDSCVFINVTTPSRAMPLSIWPNPSQDGMVHFQMDGAEYGSGILNVFDAQGRIVFQTETQLSSANAVQVGNLPPGLYTIRLNSAGYVYLGKWVRM